MKSIMFPLAATAVKDYAAGTLAAAALLMSIALTPAMAQDKARQAGDTAPWVNITGELFARLGVVGLKPAYANRCVGMAVAPTGEVFILAGKNHGVCVSKDHGATWTVVPDNNVTGRCETGFGFSMAYPYDGRLAFFTIDGTGGMTVDGGVTWRPFTKILRNFEFADVDWSAADRQPVFGLLHEPFFTTLSTDGGRNWRQLDKDAEAPKDVQKWVGQYCLGLIDANTLVRSHLVKGGIEMSADGGKTWTGVANYKVLGRRPVHFGKKVYWTTTEGVIVTTNGKDWTLTGNGPAQAVYGPYFGASEREFMVVSNKAFFLTQDGGKTWHDAAPTFVPPDVYNAAGFKATGQFNYFGWDAKNGFLYASGLAGSVYRRQLSLH